MSAVVPAGRSPRLLTAPPARALVPALARQEARRLLLHPLMLVPLAFFVLYAGKQVVFGSYALPSFETVDSMSSFFPGIFSILAANLVATRDHRAGSRDMLAPMPGRPVERVRALCLASLAPAAFTLLLVVLADLAFLADHRFPEAPTVWHILQGPVTVLGGCLLGVMLAAWSPVRGTAVIAMVVMVAANVWLSSSGLTPRLFGPMMSWPDWGVYSGEVWVGLLPGDPAGHVLYLLGLCGLAASAAVLRVAERRTPVVAAGVAFLALAVAGGLVQLP